MSQKVLTVKQAKNRINTFGKSLVLYVIVLTVFRYGIGLFEKYLPEIFLEREFELFVFVGLNILVFLLSFLPFKIAASKLEIKVKDYYKKINIPFGEIFMHVCFTIGINLLTTSIMSIFSFFFSVNKLDTPFLGKFNTTDLIITNIAYFIYMIIVKPFCDEYAFRGVIQRALGKFGRYFGVIGSAILYMLAQRSIVEAIPAFFIGWYLSSVSLKYHSIRPTIVIQSINAIYFIIIAILPSSLYILIPISVIIIYTIISFSLFFKHKTFTIGNISYGDKKLWNILFTSKSIIILVILFIMNVVLSFVRF